MSDQLIARLRREVWQTKIAADKIDLFGEAPPAELLAPYSFDGVAGGPTRAAPKKYRDRAKNIRRSWNRLQLFLPEALSSDARPLEVFEMSTAHGAMLEILRHFGHRVTGNDFANMALPDDAGHRSAYRRLNDPGFARDTDDFGLPISEGNTPDWPYRDIIESIGLDVRLFDGGRTPYPLEDKSFDVVICMQAMAHYCHPRDWMDVVDEFCRIARSKIVILLNPMREEAQPEMDDYPRAYEAFRLNLRNYAANGFTCTGCHFLWGGVHGFTLTATPP